MNMRESLEFRPAAEPYSHDVITQLRNDFFRDVSYHDRQKKAAELLEQLLREQERFQAVFTTEKDQPIS